MTDETTSADKISDATIRAVIVEIEKLPLDTSQMKLGDLTGYAVAIAKAVSNTSSYAQALEDAAKVAWRYDAFKDCDNIGVQDPETGERPCTLGDDDCLCAIGAEAASEIENSIRALPTPPDQSDALREAAFKTGFRACREWSNSGKGTNPDVFPDAPQKAWELFIETTKALNRSQS